MSILYDTDPPKKSRDKPWYSLMWDTATGVDEEAEKDNFVADYETQKRLYAEQQQGTFSDMDNKNPVKQWWAGVSNSKFMNNPFVEFTTPLGIGKFATDQAANFHSAGQYAVDGNMQKAEEKFSEGAVNTATGVVVGKVLKNLIKLPGAYNNLKATVKADVARANWTPPAVQYKLGTGVPETFKTTLPSLKMNGALPTVKPQLGLDRPYGVGHLDIPKLFSDMGLQLKKSKYDINLKQGDVYTDKNPSIEFDVLEGKTKLGGLTFTTPKYDKDIYSKTDLLRDGFYPFLRAPMDGDNYFGTGIAKDLTGAMNYALNAQGHTMASSSSHTSQGHDAYMKALAKGRVTQPDPEKEIFRYNPDWQNMGKDIPQNVKEANSEGLREFGHKREELLSKIYASDTPYRFSERVQRAKFKPETEMPVPQSTERINIVSKSGYPNSYVKHTMPNNQLHGALMQDLQEANAWSKNWYEHPEFQARMHNLKGTYREDYNASKYDATEPRYRRFVGRKLDEEVGPKGSKGSFEDAINRRIADKMYIADKATPLEIQTMTENGTKAVGGVSDYVLTGDRPRNVVNSDILTKSNNDGTSGVVRDYQVSTGIHEGSHGLTMGSILLPANWRKAISAAINTNAITSRAREYLSTDTEVYARIQELRKQFKIKPGQQIHDNQSEYMFDKVRQGVTNVEAEFADIFTSSSDFAKLLNTLPAAAGIGVGLGAANNNESENKNKTN